MADHRCRSGRYCVSRTPDGAAITVKPDALCPQCIDDIQRRLEELPQLAIALRTFLGGSMKVAYESKVQATREPAAPMNVMVADLLDEIGDAIDRAEGLEVRTLVQKPAELFIVWIRDVQQKKYLDGVDRALDIARSHRRVTAVVGLHRVWDRRRAPCPNCHFPTLGSWVGSETIECTNSECQHRMPLAEYENYCIDQAR